MRTIDLLKSQKNELMSRIKAEGLEPFNFEWVLVQSSSTPATEVPRLEYCNSEFYFTFESASGNAYCKFSPGPDKIYYETGMMPWETQRVIFSKWLENLHREILEPDLWAEVDKYRINDFNNIKVENGQFTVPQVEVITMGINNIRDYIQRYALANEEQMFYVNEKLNYLIDGSKRQGKMDWFHTCMGVLISLSITLALQPEQAKTMWDLLKNAISGIVHFLPEAQ